MSTSKTKDTRTAILKAAIAIMGAEGYEGLSAARLAKAVGISKSNLFHHFGSVDDVPVAAFEMISEDIVAAQVPEDATVAEFIAAVGEVAFTTLHARRHFYAAYTSFLTRAIFDPALKAKVKASLESAKAEFTHAIAARFGDNDKDKAQALANLTLAVMDGAMLHVLLLDNDDQMRVMWTHYLDLVAAKEPS